MSAFKFISRIRLIGLICFLGLVVAPSTASASVLNKATNNLGLVYYAPMNEGVGSIAGDFSGQGNSGTLTNGPTWGAGKIGKGLTFDGTDDYVNAGNASSINNVFANGGTVSAWIYLTSGFNTSGAYVINKYDGNVTGWAFGVYNVSGTPFMYQRFSGTTAFWESQTATVPLNTWTHLAVAYNNSSNANVPTLYINGQSVAITSSSPTGSATNDSSVNMYLGNGATFDRQFNGSIDEVRIYNRALSATEVAALYRQTGIEKKSSNRLNQYNLVTSGLVGYWSFNSADVSGTTVTDRGSSAHNGTLNNTPTVVAGKSLEAYQFNGSSQTMQISATNSPFRQTSALSYSLWAKINSTGGQVMGRSTANGNGHGGLYFNSSTLYFGWTPSTPQTDTFISGSGLRFTPGQWYHLGFTMNYSTGAYALYVNGNAVPTTISQSVTNYAPSTGQDYSSGSYDYIGGRYVNSLSYFDGSLDEVRLYNRVLSANEVLQLYHVGVVKYNISSAGSIGTSNLVGWWTFDGNKLTTTTATDSSPSAGNGTLTNGPVPTLGKIGQALNFDGTDDYVDGGISSIFNFGSSDFTITLWVYPTNVTAGQYKALIGTHQGSNYANGRGWSIVMNVDNGGDLYFVAGNDTSTPWEIAYGINAGLPINQWTHIIITRSGNSFQWYKNGLAVASGMTDTDSIGNATYNLQIGNTGNERYFTGSIDDVRIYNKALSAGEVGQLYNMGK